MEDCLSSFEDFNCALEFANTNEQTKQVFCNFKQKLFNFYADDDTDLTIAQKYGHMIHIFVYDTRRDIHFWSSRFAKVDFESHDGLYLQIE